VGCEPEHALHGTRTHHCLFFLIMHRRGNQVYLYLGKNEAFLFVCSLSTFSLTLSFVFFPSDFWSFLAGRAASFYPSILGCDSVRLIHSMNEKFAL
jgi:hypothetical protein